MRIWNIFLLVGVSFVSGSVVTYVLTVEYPQLRRLPAHNVMTAVRKPAELKPQAPLLPPTVPGTSMEVDPYARTPRLDPGVDIPTPRPEEACEIIDLLRSEFMDAPSLMGAPLTEQTLNAVFQKLGDKVKISDSPVLGVEAKVKSIAQVLPGGAGYWRPLDFSQKEIDFFLREWAIWKSGDLKGLILDLRNFRDGNNLHGAAVVSSLFASPQDTLFVAEGLNYPRQVFRSQRQPLGLSPRFPILVLVNAGTRGSAEAVASVLRQKAGALLVGRKSAGEGGLFAENRMKSGRYLRMATARINASDGTPLLGGTLMPDIPVEVSPAQDREAFNAALRLGIQALAIIQMPDRLVLKEKEELDLPLDNTGLDTKAPRDLMLNVASDVILGITHSLTFAGGKKE